MHIVRWEELERAHGKVKEVKEKKFYSKYNAERLKNSLEDDKWADKQIGKIVLIENAPDNEDVVLYKRAA